MFVNIQKMNLSVYLWIIDVKTGKDLQGISSISTSYNISEVGCPCLLPQEGDRPEEGGNPSTKRCKRRKQRRFLEGRYRVLTSRWYSVMCDNPRLELILMASTIGINFCGRSDPRQSSSVVDLSIRSTITNLVRSFRKTFDQRWSLTDLVIKVNHSWRLAIRINL